MLRQRKKLESCTPPLLPFLPEVTHVIQPTGHWPVLIIWHLPNFRGVGNIGEQTERLVIITISATVSTVFFNSFLKTE